MQEDEIQAVIDERKIYNVIVRHCRGGDLHDAEIMRSCYWPEARTDHGMMPPIGVDEFVEMRSKGPIMEKLTQNYNFLGQMSCTLEGTRARVESYIISYHRVVDDPETLAMVFGETYKNKHEGAESGSHDMLIGGRYLDIFEKRGDEWRILTRVATAEWEMSGPSSKVMSEGLFKTAHGVDATFLD